jgi:hypothetical protein
MSFYRNFELNSKILGEIMNRWCSNRSYKIGIQANLLKPKIFGLVSKSFSVLQIYLENGVIQLEIRGFKFKDLGYICFYTIYFGLDFCDLGFVLIICFPNVCDLNSNSKSLFMEILPECSFYLNSSTYKMWFCL